MVSRVESKFRDFTVKLSSQQKFYLWTIMWLQHITDANDFNMLEKKIAYKQGENMDVYDESTINITK